MNSLELRSDNVSYMRISMLSITGSIGHCISSDLKMSRGLASALRWHNPCLDDFGNYPEYYVAPGSVIPIFDYYHQRWIYNLVTKSRFYHKPTYQNLWYCLTNMRIHAEMFQIPHIYVPRLGCGLDRLEFSIVDQMIHEAFQNSPIKITICSY